MNAFFRAAAGAGHRTDSRALSQTALAFEIEYPGPVDLEAERERLEALFEGSGFDLFPALGEDRSLLLLSFGGLDAVQSPEYLFEVAQALAEEIGAASVVPNISPQWRERRADAATEGLPDLVWRLCTAAVEPPDDPQWARKLIKVPEAEALGAKGAGILVGQPDTGIAEHDELRQGIDRAAGYDSLADRADPTDPLSRSMGAPGHGTATSSAVISRADGAVIGSAVEATLVPIRAVDNVIIGSGTSVARAVRHALAQGCDVITMSLGGAIAGRALRRALEAAVQRDVIVLAAAGNCVGRVVFPAWDENVIAVAGVDHQMNRWVGSSTGEDVDVSAPAQHVTVARRLALREGVPVDAAATADVNREGQGTSFAVALTAGVAALWLQHVGRDAAKSEARRRGVSLHELFRSALRASAHAPDGWDAAEMGAGVVDAAALLALPLADIPQPARPGRGGPAVGFFGLPRPLPVRFEAEANFLAFDRMARREGRTAAALETPVAPRPSAPLSDYLGERAEPLAAPAIVPEPATPPVAIADALRRLSTARTGLLERVPDGDVAAVTEAIRREGTGDILSAAEATLARRAERSAKTDRQLQRQALQAMDRRLQAVAREPAEVVASPVGRVQLEALVRLVGRPALRMSEDDAVIRDPEVGEWAAHLIPTFGVWAPLVAAVGRIDVMDDRGTWVHAGTGFVCASGKVLTNRHVADVFAEPLPSRGEQRFALRRQASIVFDNDAADDARRFAIEDVLAAGRARIGASVDLGKLDAALLSIKPHNGTSDHPTPVAAGLAGIGEGAIERVLIAGFPAEPDFEHGPQHDDPDYLAFWSRIGELFGDDYGVKYVSPGHVLDRPGAVGGDVRTWSFSHDATTLGGNSGSLIVSLRPGVNLCGLHFGGSALTLNLAHDLTSVSATEEGAFLAGTFGTGPS